MSCLVLTSPDALLDSVGQRLGPTEWLTVEQSRIDQFARATEDFQWIHVDVARAAQGPFGATIAHGYLTASLINRFLQELLEVRGTSMGVNVGVDRLRFLHPVRVGSRLRASGEVLSAKRVKGGVQSVVRVTVEVESTDRPACVADTISRFYPA